MTAARLHLGGGLNANFALSDRQAAPEPGSDNSENTTWLLFLSLSMSEGHITIHVLLQGRDKKACLELRSGSVTPHG